MMYLHRHIEDKVVKLANNFKVILVVGARQVGKSTLLQHLFPKTKTFVFDPVQDLFGAKDDPDLFLDQFSPPLILDEVQFAVELLPAIKRRVDQLSGSGLYILTSSQNLALLKNASESLAGRVAIIELDPMTAFEFSGNHRENFLEWFITDPRRVDLQSSRVLALKLYETLWRGGFPGTHSLSWELLPSFFQSYLQTYVERDVRLVGNVLDIKEFTRFFSLLAALCAQEINDSQLGRELGIAPITAKKWRALLEQTYQYFEIPAFHGNTIKRLSKKPKGYLRDTGMICHLLRIPQPEALAGARVLGALFENYGVNLLKRLATMLPVAPQFYHWRTNGGAEVDLILEWNLKLYPIEFKCKTVILAKDCSGIHAFIETYGDLVERAAIIYAGTELREIQKGIWLIPWNILLSESFSRF